MTKVVFHVDELEKWDHALSNVQNLLAYGKSSGTSYTIVVLINGDAIMGYLVARLRDQVDTLQSAGVAFHACHNSMQSHGLADSQLPAGVTVVPAGVADLAALQDDGYRYIKP
ncbi:DsrE family protein [Schleiferilactobacillus shenzhenensis]|uniref:DsrE family protein n=1 Tax=Schleiferilactobacillus shenzhenensis TaxID=1231337 RepID=UPI00040269D0|nr:DsrE family protein [Schleiferilactobacillus shenzhenensis]